MVHRRSGDVHPPGDQPDVTDQPDATGGVFILRVAAERGADRIEGVRVDRLEGLQGNRSLPGSLYATRALFGTLRASEAEYEQNSDRHSFLWSRSPSIPTINFILHPIREIFATVIGQVLPYPNGCTATSHPSLLPFECTLSGQHNVSRDPAKLRG